MRNTVGNSAPAELNALDLAQLVLCLLPSYPMYRVAAFGVKHQAEVLASLLERNDVHETGGIRVVGADLAVDLDEALHENGPGLAVVERIL